MSSSPNPWLLIHILLFLPLTHPLSAAHVNPINGTCHDKCGTLPVRFPFGTGSGCGHPDFARYIRCSSGTLQFSTGTGVYTVSSIDYPTNTLIVTDPLMSNCSSMQNSGSFNLDRASPFSIVAEDIFVLLGCSTTSPVFDQNEELCDTGSGLNFCRGLYSCKGVAGIGLAPNAPISTCCVYEPQIVLGSGFMLDLPKLQCASYASIYGYGGDEGDPMKWEFGISLQYNGSHENEACKNCEDSGGLCGFAGLAESFACICRNGVNTTNNCYGRGYAWSGTCRHKIQTKMSVGGEHDESVSDWTFHELDRHGGSLAAGNASTSDSDAKVLANVGNYENYNVLMTKNFPPGFQGKEIFQGNAIGIGEKNEGFDNFGDALLGFETYRLAKSKPLRSRRSCEFSVKPLNPLESYLTAQLYREQAQKDEFEYSSVPSPLTPTVRPLLVTDGNRIISGDFSDSFGYKLKNKGGISLEEDSNTLLGTNSSQVIGLVELPSKPEQRRGKRQLSSSNTGLPGGPFHSQGSPNGMLLFFIGITIGMMSAVVANNREVDNLNELLKQTENLVRDLHEEIEMKDMLTVKELASEDIQFQFQETIDCSRNREPISSSSKEEFTTHKSKEPDDRKVENHELMSEIEAELEAELERLELNMKASTSERISDFVELDPDFEADVVQGDLKVYAMQPCGGQPESDSDSSGTSTDHPHTANYAVSPRELSLCLHELIESRLEARIKELEAALQNSQKRVNSLEWQHIASQRGLAYGELGSSSTPESPTLVNEVNEMYNEAYGEIIRVTDTDQDTPEVVCNNNRVERDMSWSDRRLFEDQSRERWSRRLVHGKTGAWDERIERSRGLFEVVESEDEDDDEFFIRQIVEKTRQGSSF
ncbi:unnamed protein product [Camellia sinensis]